MRFFKIKSELSANCILNEFYRVSECEPHSIFDSALKPYFSSRKGIHAYVSEKKVSGYYESGELTQTKSQLQRSKTWFFITLKEKEEKTTIKGLIIGDPYLLCGIFVAVMGAIINCFRNFNFANALCFTVITLIGSGFIFSIIKEYSLLYESILNLLKKAKWRQGQENRDNTGDGSMC